MSAAKKFLFDVDFAGAADGKPAEPTITLAEHALKLADAEANAAAAGAMRGRRPMPPSNPAAAWPTRSNASRRSLPSANDALNAIETRLECEAVEVAVAVARKLAPALIAREPFAEISALASECFRQLIAAPHIAVRVNDALYAAAKEKLDDIVRAKNFEGRLVVLAEPDIAIGDCRIEWADGGITRDSATADAAVGAAVAGYLTARRNAAATHEIPRRSEHE